MYYVHVCMILFITHWNAITGVHVHITLFYNIPYHLIANEYGAFPHWSGKIVGSSRATSPSEGHSMAAGGQTNVHEENRQATAVAPSLVWV